MSVIASPTTNQSSLSLMKDSLIRIDQICDYIPIVSAITNLVDIFEKCVFKGCCSSESISSNYYFSHISNKSILRCIILLVPVLGNIIVGVYDIIQNQREISRLEKVLLEITRSDYGKYIQQLIGTEKFLAEVQKCYLESFPQEEQKRLEASVVEMTLVTLLQKLKERVLALAENDCATAKMQEIIDQIESNLFNTSGYRTELLPDQNRTKFH